MRDRAPPAAGNSTPMIPNGWRILVVRSPRSTSRRRPASSRTCPINRTPVGRRTRRCSPAQPCARTRREATHTSPRAALRTGRRRRSPPGCRPDHRTGAFRRRAARQGGGSETTFRLPKEQLPPGLVPPWGRSCLGPGPAFSLRAVGGEGCPECFASLGRCRVAAARPGSSQGAAGGFADSAARRYSALMRWASSSWSSRMTMRQAASMGVPWSTSSRARAAMRSW